MTERLTSTSHHPISVGSSSPLGVHRHEEKTNFAFFSKIPTLTLNLYHLEAPEPFLEVNMEKTGTIHHIEVSHLPKAFDYIYLSKDGLHVDPYARALTSHQKWNQPQKRLRGRFCCGKPFEWGCDARPLIPDEDLIIYEMHPHAFTAHPSSDVEWPGTFAGIIEKIPYLKELGINAVELMPIFEFDECDYSDNPSRSDRSLVNYWGYAPLHFFALMNRYGDPTQSVQTGFKCLIKALHSAGIEVILDVVYNHTGRTSPLLKGCDIDVYYRLHDGEHSNDSGCGNTLNCQNPVVQTLIIDSLRHFALNYRVDGFRFDLASILARDEEGKLLDRPPLIEKITRDPILGPLRLIAEPWDPAGAYQVGSFPSWRFAEWNGRYRDTLRCFIQGKGNKEKVKLSVLGSPDLYANYAPTRSINYICAHDGFTLSDLVSFNEKHNEANGEDNRDGMNDNYSWNCGQEGATEDRATLHLREKQKRNYTLALFTSLGTPMWLMGDEYGHTRYGNNNAWCQNNALNHFLWEEQKEDRSFFRFVAQLISLRKRSPLLKQREFIPSDEVTWYEIPNSPFLAWKLKDELLIAFNPSPQRVYFDLPSTHKRWHRFVDTSLPSPQDIIEVPSPLETAHYTFEPYSSCLFCRSLTLER